jgi:hypothetical protein
VICLLSTGSFDSLEAMSPLADPPPPLLDPYDVADEPASPEAVMDVLVSSLPPPQPARVSAPTAASAARRRTVRVVCGRFVM